MILGIMALQYKEWKRDAEYPCDDFEEGEPSEYAQCETDGHHLCSHCICNVHREEAKP